MNWRAGPTDSSAPTSPPGIVHIDENTVVELKSEFTEKKEGERRADVT